MSNIMAFPSTENKKLKKAIELFNNNTADLALNKFIKLIDDGCDEAFSFVGNLYATGGRNVERDYSKARFYYHQSVERTGALAAYLGLIRIYYYGLGVERDCCQALEYCTMLVEEINHSYANYFIGKMYMEGCCVDRDIEKAKLHFKKSWDQGYVFGLTELGFAEQKTGHYLRGLLFRIKAGITAFRISRQNKSDARIREQ